MNTTTAVLLGSAMIAAASFTGLLLSRETNATATAAPAGVTNVSTALGDVARPTWAWLAHVNQPALAMGDGSVDLDLVDLEGVANTTSAPLSIEAAELPWNVLNLSAPQNGTILDAIQAHLAQAPATNTAAAALSHAGDRLQVPVMAAHAPQTIIAYAPATQSLIVVTWPTGVAFTYDAAHGWVRLTTPAIPADACASGAATCGR